MGMPGANLTSMRDPAGNRVYSPVPLTQNSNPFGQNAMHGQYNPYNEYFTQNPGRHPYSPS